MNAVASLACAFPPDQDLRGACTTIADLQLDLSFCNRLFIPECSKRTAVRLIVQANMERMVAMGNGNKAEKRRITILESAAFEAAQSVKAIGERMKKNIREHACLVESERYAEGRRSSYHDIRALTNFHE